MAAALGGVAIYLGQRSGSLAVDEDWGLLSQIGVQGSLHGLLRRTNFDAIWKAKSENKVKFLSWLMLHDHLLTADRLLRCGWVRTAIYPMCSIHEFVNHLFLSCSFAKQIWRAVASWSGYQVLEPAITPQDAVCASWWLRCRKEIQKEERKNFDRYCLILLLAYLEGQEWTHLPPRLPDLFGFNF